MLIGLPGSSSPQPARTRHCNASTLAAQTQHGFDAICFTGKPEPNTPSKTGFWDKLRHLLLAPFRWLKILWQGSELKPGSPAPDFTLTDHTGRRLHLYDALQQGPVVLFFYPKNNTAFCTKQVQAFRDTYPEFQKLGASVFGISSDSEKSHQQFNAQQKLPFLLLSDPGGKVRRQYGARSFGGLIPNRSTFVIDGPTRSIRTVYSSQANISAHINKALQGLKQES
jgi:peroxiredoxin Q/BCP